VNRLKLDYRKESSKKRKGITPAKCEHGVGMRIIDVRREERKIFFKFFHEPKEFKSDFKS